MSSMFVGYFSYDIIRLIEKIPNTCKEDIKIPDIRIMRPKNLIIYDNIKSKIFFIENIFKDEKIFNYELKYSNIKKAFLEFKDFTKIRLPENFYQKKKYQN